MVRMIAQWGHKASVFQGMSILACFSPEQRSLTAAEIAEMIDLPSTTVQERLDALVRCGYLQPGTSGACRLAERLPKDLLLACS
jgi:DNA-binding IclR family transcriptional regulator